MLLKKSLGLLTTAAIFLGSSAMAAVKSKNIVYKKGTESFEGILFTPDSVRGKAPGILMIANWMGVSDETKKQAERFANLGYVVFAADIYGQGKNPKTPDAAGKLSGSYKADRKLFRENLILGFNELKKQTNVDTSKLAAVGYCFGGTGVLELARSGADVKGVLSFHGALDSPAPADGKNIKAHVIAFHGADDPYVKAEDIVAFEKEMRDSKVDWELVKYGNAVHSFTEQSAGSDNSKGAAYNEKADQRSFAEAERFLKEIL